MEKACTLDIDFAGCHPANTLQTQNELPDFIYQELLYSLYLSLNLCTLPAFINVQSQKILKIAVVFYRV
jgi:hypothetical protein